MNLPFMDKLLKIVPDHPLMQSRYIYYLSLIVFMGLLGFALTSWYNIFFVMFSFTTMFQAIFISAISLLSLAGVKQARAAFIATKAVYAQMDKVEEQEEKVETPEEMMEGFK